jgi:PKD repeat protein
VSEAQTVVRPITVSPSLLEAGVQAFWDEGDVRLSMVSPSGRVVDRTTEAPDVLHPGGPTSQTLVVKHPDAGQWMIQLYGASVQASGEPVSLSVTEIPQSDFAPIEYVSAVPDRGVAPVTIQFDGTTTATHGATITSYRWDFGDCSSPVSTPNPSHVFTTAGTYAVSVTATDSNGQAGTADLEIVVTAYKHAPTASFVWGILDPAKPTLVGFSGQPSIDIDGHITSYAWSFGDGATGSGESSFHPYAKAGTYRVSLTVTDDGGLTAMACQMVTTGVVVGPTAACPV